MSERGFNVGLGVGCSVLAFPAWAGVGVGRGGPPVLFLGSERRSGGQGDMTFASPLRGGREETCRGRPQCLISVPWPPSADLGQQGTGVCRYRGRGTPARRKAQRGGQPGNQGRSLRYKPGRGPTLLSSLNLRPCPRGSPASSTSSDQSGP